MIEVRAVCKTFKVAKSKQRKLIASDPREEGGRFHALKDLSFAVPDGKIVGLIGMNGAGKTTLLRILSTAIQPTSGTALIDGEDVVSNAIGVRRKIGFLSGHTGLYGRLTPRELLTYFGKLHGLSSLAIAGRIGVLFDELDIGAFAHRRCDLLSTGMKQKVSIARSLVHDPSVIIFDEPTTGLDVSAAQTILEFIANCRRKQKSVIFSTHHMHEVDKLCDWVIVVHRGEKYFEGTVTQIREATGKQELDDAYLTLVGKDVTVRGPAYAN